MVVADAHGTVVVFNRAAELITRTSAAAALGKDLEDALPLEGLDGRAWWPCALTRTPGSAPSPATPSGTCILPGVQEVLVTSRYVRDEPRGPVTRVVVALRGTRHRAREELSRAELVSTVAHELRSPLTSVKGFTATLLAKWDRFTDEQKRLMLETVNADADRVTRLITELLDISRIDSGRLTMQPPGGRPRPAWCAGTSPAWWRAGRTRPGSSAGRRDGTPGDVGRRRQGRPGPGQPARERAAARRRDGDHRACEPSRRRRRR